MRIQGLTMLLAICLAGALCSAGQAYPIVTMPTANLVSEGNAWLNYYWVDLNATNPHAPQTMQIGATYIGLTPKFELDITYLKPESVPGQTNVGVEYLALREDRKRPAVAVGAEDITQDSGHTSLYVALAKTVTPMKDHAPSYPMVRLNLGYGTEPRSALFGGAQIRLVPEVGISALSDGHNSIYCLSYFVPKTTLVLKAGTWGDARWVGAQYTIPFR